jgi:hypothetical protein
VSEQMDGQPAPPSSCVVNVRSITAEVPYASREALCTWFVCREPLAEALRPFVGDRCQRFACQKPLAEALGPFEAYRGSFEEPLRERPAGRNPRAETLPSPREDASLPRESLSTFSSRLHSKSGTARALFVLGLSGDRICAMTRFEHSVLGWFGLPPSLSR